MQSPRFDVILTADRSMMSNYHRKEFLGFGTTGPIFVELPFGFSERFHSYLFAPKLKTDKWGRPVEAPYGMRKIEAKLLDAGINAAVIDPEHVHKYLPHAKVLMLSHHDYFGLNPPSSTWGVIVGKEPMNAVFFKGFMERLSPHIWKAKAGNGLRVIVGGPAAWQWLYFPELVDKWGIDTIFDGEGERLVVDLVRRAVEGKPLPKYIYVGVGEAPSLEEISTIKYPSINGLVEIGRGCPRGCAFCSVTLRAMRWYPLEKIEEELKVNARAGVVDGILHSDEVPLYGSTTVEPNPEKLVALHKLAKRYYRKVGWSHTTFVAVYHGEKKMGKLFTKLSEIILDEHQDWWGAQIGLETGSVRLARKIMPGKAAPYKIDQWHEIVEEAAAIMHEIRLIPAITLIVGLPDEQPDDVVETIELVERLRPYRSLIVPLFYVPMSHVRTDKAGWLDKLNLYPEHIDLLEVVARHSIYWAKDIVNKFYFKGPQYFLVRFLVNYFINYVEKRLGKIKEDVEHYKEALRQTRNNARKEVLTFAS
ncbi:MAG: radical SAM protein [Pyrobaculum arsenaticum]|uniref:Radical SAM domain protein n=2 Tax=Pyrobaculum arsenaticum TaxID=121277 RepID=A4WN90_PYRAR|nr:radical SAM protein [Pyrobaculum arsenaticum]ABP51857.1 Radical SAM domain protein [Pyrobaculum arsenaticum DSM 13514]MCY0891449.1 radical SAM protein [Pyrobaculum arsenaticum]NYR16177.1 B12-binding domain-containing radical SAM protein [Pyrobaculum arsenaticum]